VSEQGRRRRPAARTPKATGAPGAKPAAPGKKTTPTATTVKKAPPGEKAPKVSAPPRRIRGTDLSTGLVDYGMWVKMFSEADPTEPVRGRRGRIWA
jgi:cyanobactin cluster PatC/TenC/TruC protein